MLISHKINYEVENKLFSSCIIALKKEDAELRELFETGSNSGMYSKWSHGIRVLFETGIAYIIVKEYLKTSSEYEISWEYSYPENSKLKMDIALLKNETLHAGIEIKIWAENNDIRIKNDEVKLKANLDETVSKYVLVIWYHRINSEENITWLKERCNVIKYEYFDSRFIDKGKQITGFANIALIKA